MDEITADAETPERNPTDDKTTGDEVATLPPEAGAPIGPAPRAATKPVKDSTGPAMGYVRPLDPPAPPAVVRQPTDALGERRLMHPAAGPPQQDRGTALLIGTVSGVLGAALVVATLAVAGVFDRPETIIREITSPAPPQIIVDAAPSSTAAAVALKVVPSIVTVEVGSNDGDDALTVFGSGSGVVLTVGARQQER